MKQIIWKPVPELYDVEVSNMGEIRQAQYFGKRSYFFPLKYSRKGDYVCYTYKSKRYLIHRLVATAFIPNPEKKPFINHKNGVKHDNRMENLEWCTNHENLLHSINVLGNKPCFKRRPVQVIKRGRVICDTKTISEAARFVNGSYEEVTACCRGERGEYKGFSFKYGQNV